MQEPGSAAGPRAVGATLLGLAAITTGAGIVLALTDPTYTWYALWTFSDTGLLQLAASYSFVLVLAWLFVASRLRMRALISAVVTAGLFAASVAVASGEVRGSMRMGNSEFIHFVPGTWSVILAWIAGALVAFAAVLAIRLVLAKSQRPGAERLGI